MTCSTCLFPIFFLCTVCMYVDSCYFLKSPLRKGGRFLLTLGIYVKGGFFSIDRGRSFSARGTDGSRARFRESLGWWRAHGPEPNTLFQPWTTFKKYSISMQPKEIARPLNQFESLPRESRISFFKRKKER